MCDVVFRVFVTQTYGIFAEKPQETKLKIARIGADNGNSKMCIIDNIQFECVRAAYNYVNEKYGIYRRAFYKKLNDINEPNWFYK
jgi:hypothetical protein